MRRATHIGSMVTPSVQRTPASRSAVVPHGPLHVVSEVATMAAAALFHGSVAVTARVARLFGVKIP